MEQGLSGKYISGRNVKKRSRCIQESSAFYGKQPKVFYDRNLPAGKDIWTRKPPGCGSGTISREDGSTEKYLWRDCPDKRGRSKKPKRNGCRIWLRIIFLENLRRRRWDFRQRNILWMERAGEKTPDKQRPGKARFSGKMPCSQQKIGQKAQPERSDTGKERIRFRRRRASVKGICAGCQKSWEQARKRAVLP